MSLSQTSYLRHILDEVEFIQQALANISRESFLADEVLKRAIVRSFEIIGEAARNLSSEIREKYPQVIWREMIGMRNILIHNYVGVDYGIVWDTTRADLPEIQQQIEQILDNENNAEANEND